MQMCHLVSGTSFFQVEIAIETFKYVSLGTDQIPAEFIQEPTNLLLILFGKIKAKVVPVLN